VIVCSAKLGGACPATFCDGSARAVADQSSGSDVVPRGRSGSSSARRGDRRIDVAPTVSLPSVGRYPASTPSTSRAARILGTAEDYIGVPTLGVSTGGFDCSGSLVRVANQGVRPDRARASPVRALSPDWRAVSAGDLVMFEENGRISHVAIYAGHNRIIHSSASGGGVRYDDLGTRRGEWFVDHMVAARRITPDARGLFLDLARDFADGPGLQFDGPDHAPKPIR
jgi:cell wall-associated NlpC family hydrolase